MKHVNVAVVERIVEAVEDHINSLKYTSITSRPIFPRGVDNTLIRDTAIQHHEVDIYEYFYIELPDIDKMLDDHITRGTPKIDYIALSPEAAPLFNKYLSARLDEAEKSAISRLTAQRKQHEEKLRQLEVIHSEELERAVGQAILTERDRIQANTKTFWKRLKLLFKGAYNEFK